MAKSVRACRVCGCTDNDCSQCIKKTGSPCWWVEADLCSACDTQEEKSSGKTKKAKTKLSSLLTGLTYFPK